MRELLNILASVGMVAALVLILAAYKSEADRADKIYRHTEEARRKKKGDKANGENSDRGRCGVYEDDAEGYSDQERL